MRTERIQYNQLCMQNVCNTFRKNAQAVLVASRERFSPRQPVRDPHLLQALRIFKEPVDYDITAGVPELRDLTAVLPN